MKRGVPILALVGVLVVAACGDDLAGDGNVVTETRTIGSFDAVEVNNGVEVVFAMDPAVSGNVDLQVTTDSNLMEYLTTGVSGAKLTVSADRRGGFTPTGPFKVEATVGPLGEVSVNNGARVEITGSVGEASLSVNNGAHFTGESFEAVTVRVDANNGAIVSVCATGTVTGEVNNGARLTVLCGGNVTGVETANGGSVSAS